MATCDGGACLIVAMNAASSMVVGSPVFILERSRDNTGAPTGDGLSFAVTRASPTSATASAPPNQFRTAAYDSMAQCVGAIPVVVPSSIAGASVGAGSSLATGVIAPVLPWVAFAPGLAPWQPLAGLTYVPGDAVPGAIITVRLLGRDRTYRVLPVGAGHNGWGVILNTPASSAYSGNRALGLMVLWED